MVDRQTELARCFDVIEVDITLLGATGVEDQLQEEVQETLESQKISGIQVTILLYSYFNVLPIQQLIIFLKIWVLTGDKFETAFNIAHSCGHFKRGMYNFELSSSEEV